MASRCLGRLTGEKLHFGDGHCFLTEKRCKKMTMGRLCNKCINREPIKKGKKPGNDDHGIVTDEIPPLSHIYGSQWYNLNLTSNGNPSSEDMAKAKKSQEEARADVIATVSDKAVSATTVSATTVSATAVKKRTFKVAATATEPAQLVAAVPVPIQVAALVATPVAATTPVKAKRQPKKVAVQLQETVKPLATESVEPPLHDLNCITITVRKIEHNGRKYYLNSDKDKLYTVMPDGGVGKYCGRLDKENDRIADFPDSDSER
jgi:hypothetical protein